MSLYPKNFARFYDLIYHQIRDGVDNDFFLNEVKKINGKVLEIGVGTGRFFIDALNSGADVYGIDISDTMLEVLKSKLDKGQHYRVCNGDFINFNFDHQFDLIMAPFRVISHIIDKSDQIAGLNNVCKHLKPGGKFIFDVFVPDLGMLIKGLDKFTDFEGEYEPGKKMKRTVSTKSDLINQIIHITFEMNWEEESEIKTDVWNLPFRFFFRHELEHLVERSDFKEYNILGDYMGNTLNENSKEMIVVCVK